MKNKLESLSMRIMRMVAKSIKLSSSMVKLTGDVSSFRMCLDLIFIQVPHSRILKIQIVDSLGKLGWLYGKESIVFFFDEKDRYYNKTVNLSALKDYTESELKKKVFISPEETPRHGTIMKNEDKSICGFLDYDTMVEYLEKKQQNI